jgi:hypothetical protein
MGNAPYDTLSAARIASIEGAFVAAAGGGGGGGASLSGITAQVLYAPVDGSTAGLEHTRSVSSATQAGLSQKPLTSSHVIPI